MTRVKTLKIIMVILTLFSSAPSWAQSMPVTVAIVNKGPIKQVYHGFARVQPLMKTHPSSSYAGRIVQILAHVGEKVSLNQPLARIKPLSKNRDNSSLFAAGGAYTVVANVPGIIVGENYSLGDVIPSGAPVFTLVPDTGFRVALSIPLQYSPGIDYATKATIHLASGAAHATPSSIRAFDMSGTGYFLVEFVVTKNKPVLGSVIPVDVVVKHDNSALLIPANAVVEKNGAFFVFVVKNGKAIQTLVKIGIQTPSSVQILSGLHPGEKVVTTGQYSLEDGAKVTVVSTGG